LKCAEDVTQRKLILNDVMGFDLMKPRMITYLPGHTTHDGIQSSETVGIQRWRQYRPFDQLLGDPGPDG